MSEDPDPHALRHARERPLTQHHTSPLPNSNDAARTLPIEGIDAQSDPFAAQFQHDLQPLTEDKSAGQETGKTLPALPDRSSPKP